MAAHPVLAIVRPPTPAIALCELTHIERQPIAVERALAQHHDYTALIRRLGADVITLPPEPDLPDAVFVEDVAVVLDELAILTNPGAPSRRAEVAGVAAALEPHRALFAIRDPATLDGGDVIVAGRAIRVGLSGRSNRAGIEQLREIVEPHGYRVRSEAVHGCLHLKSACTWLGGGAWLVNPDWVDPASFGPGPVLPVHPSEPRAANTFRVGDAVVMAGGFPATRELLERHGFTIHTVDLSELQKAEAGGSCMSLIFRA
jgi:dimethylargininase